MKWALRSYLHDDQEDEINCDDDDDDDVDDEDEVDATLWLSAGAYTHVHVNLHVRRSQVVSRHFQHCRYPNVGPVLEVFERFLASSHGFEMQRA